jgi:hypothetical protein
MRKTTITAFVFIIPLIVIGSLILIGIGTATNEHTDCRNQESFDIENSSVTINNGNYNISYSVYAIRPITIDKIRINPCNITIPSANSENSGVTIYINSNLINIANPLDYHVNSKNSLQVNVIIPMTVVNSNETSIAIFTDQAMFYKAMNLVQNPSETT